MENIFQGYNRIHFDIGANEGVFATWLAASATSAPKPDQIRWSWLKDSTKIYKLTTENFGMPDKYLATDGKTIIFTYELFLGDTVSISVQTKAINTNFEQAITINTRVMSSGVMMR